MKVVENNRKTYQAWRSLSDEVRDAWCERAKTEPLLAYTGQVAWYEPIIPCFADIFVGMRELPALRNQLDQANDHILELEAEVDSLKNQLAEARKS